MAISITTTAELARTQGVNILVYGAAGSGKTMACATLPNPIILSAEAGLLSLKNLAVPSIRITCWADFEEAYQFILQSAEANAYDSICIDSISEIATICYELHESQNKNPNDKWSAFGNMANDIIKKMREFRDLPKNVYVSAKQEYTKDEGTGVLHYAPSCLGKKIGNELPYQFDEVFCLRVEEGEKGIEHMLQTRSDSKHVAKDRSGVLEAFEPVDLGQVINKILRTKKQGAKYGNSN